MFSLFCPNSASIELFPIALAGEIPCIAFNERSLTKFNSQHRSVSNGPLNILCDFIQDNLYRFTGSTRIYPSYYELVVFNLGFCLCDFILETCACLFVRQVIMPSVILFNALICFLFNGILL